jgi:type IV secretory pathway VirD2 relaxase
MSDLKTFTRDLMGQMEKDLGTKLDWVGVDHWNTDNPHVHSSCAACRRRPGPRHLARLHQGRHARPRAGSRHQELGPRTDLEIRRNLERQVEAERWTSSTASLSATPASTGVIDLAPHPDRQPDEFHALKVGRLRKLEPSASPTRSAPANG